MNCSFEKTHIYKKCTNINYFVNYHQLPLPQHIQFQLPLHHLHYLHFYLLLVD